MLFFKYQAMNADKIITNVYHVSSKFQTYAPLVG